MSSTPRRVGLVPTAGNTTSLPGVIAAATRKNAADDKSAGTVTSTGDSAAAGSIVTWLFPRRTLAPIAASMRSVWSRLGPGSITVTGLAAYSPAISSALFNCALATGSV